jgi:hypothetical protein
MKESLLFARKAVPVISFTLDVIFFLLAKSCYMKVTDKSKIISNYGSLS